MKPEDYADAYGKAFQYAAEEPVTLEVAARQLGCTPEQAHKAFNDQGEKFDAALVPLRGKKSTPISVSVWQSSFQRAADAVHGVSRPYKVREEKK